MVTFVLETLFVFGAFWLLERLLSWKVVSVGRRLDDGRLKWLVTVRRGRRHRNFAGGPTLGWWDTEEIGSLADAWLSAKINRAVRRTIVLERKRR